MTKKYTSQTGQDILVFNLKKEKKTINNQILCK